MISDMGKAHACLLMAPDSEGSGKKMHGCSQQLNQP